VTRAIARVDELRPGETKKFLLECDGQEIEGFLLNYAGEHHAYVNRCRHVPMSLDWVENQFFTEDGNHILCATHGACYAPDTGECIGGPPLGKVLIRVPLDVVGDEVRATCPEEAIPEDVRRRLVTTTS
jgi:nitrite reductase/ring-hydroxylating ferredoxin subunit